MKKYFAKHLPVEGEIKEGDICYFKRFNEFGTAKMEYGELCFVSFPQEGKGSLTSPISRNLDDKRPYKLFICSRDIQVGDKIKAHHLQGEGDITDETVDEVDGDMIWLVNNPDVDIKYAYKVIGEISPEAVWIKEGDEFDEEEIQRIRESQNDYQLYIQVKCPTCKNYH